MPEDLLKEAVPGNIRKAEHFVAFLKRFVEYMKVSSFCYLLNLIEINALKTRMRVLHVVAETPLSFLQHLKDITYIERRPLRCERLFEHFAQIIILFLGSARSGYDRL